MMLETCPFCGGSKIKYSIKTKTKYFQAAFYCATCHAYGPRILSDSCYESLSYSSRYAVRKDKDLEERAADAWNSQIHKKVQM